MGEDGDDGGEPPLRSRPAGIGPRPDRVRLGPRGDGAGGDMDGTAALAPVRRMAAGTGSASGRGRVPIRRPSTKAARWSGRGPTAASAPFRRPGRIARDIRGARR